MNDTRPKKPPACDACKARRVLCHPQPNGAPCPRCAGKEIICTTSRATRGRGRPRKNPVIASAESRVSPEATPRQQLVSQQVVTLQYPQVNEPMNGCLDLTPELVRHFFQCFDRLPHVRNPLIQATSIRATIRAVSYQLHLLPAQSWVLARCIIALSSLISFHEVVLGDGPRPESFTDEAFFSSRSHVLSCGARRSATHRALHTEALRAAWDSGVMLQVSNENAASCFLLDILESMDSCRASRPWVSAYISHLRALAPGWRTTSLAAPYGGYWAGYLMAEALGATSSRTPILFTRDEQLLLCGVEPAPLEAVLASLEAPTRKSGTSVLFDCFPYMFHVTCLARQLWETITGDRARLSPVSEVAVIQFLASLSVVHAILSRLLERAESALRTSDPNDHARSFLLDDAGSGLMRTAASGLILGFAALALRLHRELEHRERTGPADENTHTAARIRLVRSQAHDMAALGARELARAIRYFPPVHYPLAHDAVQNYAEFALEATAAAPVVSHEQVQDLETWVYHMHISATTMT
ncbi:hypothetical protein B0H10DRAFT_1991699 [Mycena sp. CBHHK59/15]|nr:hypothetical protein B0H10DRAFT_1991699 [Mycena sp. CBHHK59/15]